MGKEKKRCIQVFNMLIIKHSNSKERKCTFCLGCAAGVLTRVFKAEYRYIRGTMVMRFCFFQYIIKFSTMFAERRTTVNHIALVQQACTSSPCPQERWLWHSYQSYLSLAEGHGQEQQLTHIKSHITPACKNLSTDNKPAILIFFFFNSDKKAPFSR